MKANFSQAISSIIIFFTLFTSTDLFAQSKKISKEVESRIQKVERSLAGWIKTQEDTSWTIQDRMAYYKVPGVSIAVVNNYKIEWSKAYGVTDVEKTTPVTHHTLFQAASLSKSLNAVGVLRLVQENKINLEEDINKYLKSWLFPYDSLSKGKKISTGNLLSHSAGLTVHGFPGYSDKDTLPTIYQILDGQKPANTSAVRSDSEPGLKTQYSGGGTTISQLMVMEITGQSYDKYMKKNVLEPIGMKESSYAQPFSPAKNQSIATGYYGNGDKVEGKYHIYPEQAAAGLWTTPTDLGKFIVETQLSLIGKSNKVLSQEITTRMLTPYIDSVACLGVFTKYVGKDRYFGHTGSNNGFKCEYIASLEGGKGVVVMVNSEVGGITKEIVNAVASVYGWKDFYTPVIKNTVKVPVEILDAYVGSYQTPYFSFSVTRLEDKLMVQAPGQPMFDLFPESHNKFFLKVIDAQLEFIQEPDGQILKSIFSQNGNIVEAKRIK